MALIYVIRHGQASFGAADYDALSETGIRQSEALGEYFYAAGVRFDSVYTGAMKRQADTARIVMEKAPGCFGGAAPVEIPELNEHESDAILKSQLTGMIEEEPGMAEHLEMFFEDKKVFNKLFTKAMERWVSGKHDAPGVETFIEFNRRVMEGFGRVARENGSDGKAAVFTSGGVIAAVVQSALAIPNEKAMRLPWWTRNASVTVVRHTEKNLDLLCFNSTAHLEMKNDPGLLTYK